MLGTLFLIIGKVCSGKTTFAKGLAQDHNAVVLSCDELLLTLHSFSNNFDFDAEIGQAKKYLWELTIKLLNIGTNVILDWGFWDVKERDAINSFLSENGFPHEWHYMKPDDDLWQERICSRNSNTSSTEFFIDSGLLDKCNEKFNTPSIAELNEKEVIIHDQ